MGCNCASGKELDRLYKQFGTRIKPTAKESIGFYTKYYIERTAIAFLMIFIVPYIIGYFVYKIITNEGKVSVMDFFGLKRNTFKEAAEYVRYQQGHKNKN